MNGMAEKKKAMGQRKLGEGRAPSTSQGTSTLSRCKPWNTLEVVVDQNQTQYTALCGDVDSLPSRQGGTRVPVLFLLPLGPTGRVV